MGINLIICWFQSISQSVRQSINQSMSIYKAQTKVISWHFPYWEGLNHTPQLIIYRDPTSPPWGSTLWQWQEMVGGHLARPVSLPFLSSVQIFYDSLPDYRACMELVFSHNQTLAKISAAELCVENLLAQCAGKRVLCNVCNCLAEYKK